MQRITATAVGWQAEFRNQRRYRHISNKLPARSTQSVQSSSLRFAVNDATASRLWFAEPLTYDLLRSMSSKRATDSYIEAAIFR